MKLSRSMNKWMKSFAKIFQFYLSVFHSSLQSVSWILMKSPTSNLFLMTLGGGEHEHIDKAICQTLLVISP